MGLIPFLSPISIVYQTPSSTLKNPKKWHAVDVIREPSSKFRRTKRTSSAISQNLRGDGKAKRITLLASGSVSRTRTSTIHQNTDLLSESPTRTLLPKLRTLGFRVMLSSVPLMLMSFHDTVLALDFPTIPLHTPPVFWLVDVFSKRLDLTQCMKVRLRSMGTNSMRRLTLVKRHHSDATLILDLPVHQPVPESSVY